MHREHAPRFQLEYRIREVEGERQRKRDRRNERTREARGSGAYRFPRLCTVTVEGCPLPFSRLSFLSLVRFNNPRPP